jgi:hypothetical protein
LQPGSLRTQSLRHADKFAERRLMMELDERVWQLVFIRDRDGKSTASFDEVFTGNGAWVIHAPVPSTRRLDTDG